jgi:uncharacterized protein YdhG (YjbR/CyaY superfamily)
MPTRAIPEPDRAEVEKYYASAPPESRTNLQALRDIVLAAAPGASEFISYQLPTFRYNGGLVAIGAWRDYCSMYVMSNAVLDAFAEELGPFMGAKSTLRFPHQKPLPADLITRMVKARVLENEASAAEKQAKGPTKKGSRS